MGSSLQHLEGGNNVLEAIGYGCKPGEANHTSLKIACEFETTAFPIVSFKEPKTPSLVNSKADLFVLFCFYTQLCCWELHIL